jgi:hypothetical protein
MIPANHQPLALLVVLRLRNGTVETRYEVPGSWAHLSDYPGTTHTQFAVLSLLQTVFVASISKCHNLVTDRN